MNDTIDDTFRHRVERALAEGHGEGKRPLNASLDARICGNCTAPMSEGCDCGWPAIGEDTEEHSVTNPTAVQADYSPLVAEGKTWPAMVVVCACIIGLVVAVLECIK